MDISYKKIGRKLVDYIESEDLIKVDPEILKDEYEVGLIIWNDDSLEKLGKWHIEEVNKIMEGKSFKTDCGSVRIHATMKAYADIEKCPRCGENHKNLVLYKIEKPILDEYSRWASCPNTGHPILFPQQFIGIKEMEGK